MNYNSLASEGKNHFRLLLFIYLAPYSLPHPSPYCHTEYTSEHQGLLRSQNTCMFYKHFEVRNLTKQLPKKVHTDANTWIFKIPKNTQYLKTKHLYSKLNFFLICFLMRNLIPKNHTAVSVSLNKWVTKQKNTLYILYIDKPPGG